MAFFVGHSCENHRIIGGLGLPYCEQCGKNLPPVLVLAQGEPACINDGWRRLADGTYEKVDPPPIMRIYRCKVCQQWGNHGLFCSVGPNIVREWQSDRSTHAKVK